MRKRKTVFFDSLLVLAICWGISRYFNRSDNESVLLLAGCLLYICALIIIPIGLSTLKTSNPIMGGLYLLLMLSPLVIAMSYPLLSLTNFHIALSKIILLSEIKPIIINFLVNGFFFFLAGYIFVLINRKHTSKWKGAVLTSFILTSIYGLSFYLLYIQPTGLMNIIGEL